MKKILFVILCIVAFSTACSRDEEVKTVDKVNIKELQEHKGTLVGNNSAVSSIINSLPGGLTNKEFELSNQSIKVRYGAENNKSNSSNDKLSSYWLNGDTIEENFLFNAAAIFILVKNVEQVIFELDYEKQYSFSISKTDLGKELPHSLSEYAENETLWKEEILNDFVKEKIKRQEFFAKYPIKQN